MSLVLNGTSQYLKLSSALVSASPLFMCAWVKPTNVLGFKVVTAVSSTTATANMKYLVLNGATLSAIDAVASSAAASVTSAATAGSWRFVAGILNSPTDRTGYSDSSSTNNTTSKIPTSLDTSTIGAKTYFNAGLVTDNFFAGRIGYVGFWNSDQSANIAALRAGTTPDNFPSGLLAYLSLVSDATDTKGNSWSNQGSATFDAADNPPVILPPPSTSTARSGLLLARRRRAA